MKLSTKRSFTLVELLVTITIIGILATIGVATYSRAQMRARDAKRKADMVTIQNALEMYASENNGNYPSQTGSWAESTDGDNWIPDLRPTYIKKIPKETYHETSWPYKYISDTACTGGYKLVMHLETESGDPCTCNDGSTVHGGDWDCWQNP